MKAKKPEVTILPDGTDGCGFDVVILNGHYTKDEIKKIIPSLEFDGIKLTGEVGEYGYKKYRYLSEDEVRELEDIVDPDEHGHYPGWEYVKKLPGMNPIKGPYTRVTVLVQE